MITENLWPKHYEIPALLNSPFSQDIQTKLTWHHNVSFLQAIFWHWNFQFFTGEPEHPSTDHNSHACNGKTILGSQGSAGLLYEFSRFPSFLVWWKPWQSLVLGVIWVHFLTVKFARNKFSGHRTTFLQETAIPVFCASLTYSPLKLQCSSTFRQQSRGPSLLNAHFRCILCFHPTFLCKSSSGIQAFIQLLFQSRFQSRGPERWGFVWTLFVLSNALPDKRKLESHFDLITKHSVMSDDTDHFHSSETKDAGLSNRTAVLFANGMSCGGMHRST